MKKRTVKTEGTVKSDRKFLEVDLDSVVSNEEQSRGHCVCPALEAAGYGIVQPLRGHEDMKPIMALLLSDKPEEMAEGVGLIDHHQPDIVKQAETMMVHGQMQNVRITPAVDDHGKEVPGQWSLRFGMRRALAKAYLHAKSVGKIPARVLAEVVEREEETVNLLNALEKNVSGKNESPIDQAKFYLRLETTGMTLNEIAEHVGEDYQTIRNRLQLLQLPANMQDRIHAGKLGMVKALKQHAEIMEKHGKPEQDERQPTVKQVEALYNADERPVDNEALGTVTEEEWALLTEDVRKWMAFRLGIEYRSRRELKRMK